MKVLLVEDEKRIAAFLCKGLREERFVVDVEHRGDEGLERAMEGGYDAVVLDIMLPGRDGLGILRELRRRGNNVPVLVLTARGEISERVEGLNLGADDYLAKPFAVDEVIARLHALARRASGVRLSVLKLDDLTLNLITREVQRAGNAIELTTREFALLEYLLRSPGRVFTRTNICEHVWDYHFDTETNLVDVYIQRLRKKMDTGYSAKLIRTVRGVGYAIGASE